MIDLTIIDECSHLLFLLIPVSLFALADYLSSGDRPWLV